MGRQKECHYRAMYKLPFRIMEGLSESFHCYLIVQWLKQEIVPVQLEFAKRRPARVIHLLNVRNMASFLMGSRTR